MPACGPRVPVDEACIHFVLCLRERGEIGQHQEGMRTDVGTAYGALHLCIELAASLQRDLLAAP